MMSSLPVEVLQASLIVITFYSYEIMEAPKDRKNPCSDRDKIRGPHESGSWPQNSTYTLSANLHPECQFLEL